jgi:hypothetical protein
MQTPEEQIRDFLIDRGVPQSRRLQTSLLFAQSMVRELEATSTEWQAILASLRQIERETDRARASSN